MNVRDVDMSWVKNDLCYDCVKGNFTEMKDNKENNNKEFFKEILIILL